MDKDIDFRNDINLIVGINGSGKTSVLNVVSWLLQPSIPHLCMTEFHEVRLDFSQDGADAVIRCTQTETEFQFFLEGTAYVDFAPLTVQLARPPASIRTLQDREEMFDAYKGLRPDAAEQKTWAALRRMSSPIVVGLERTLHSDQLELQVSQSKAHSLGFPPELIESAVERAPIKRVQQLTTDAYSRYRTRLIQINEQLRQKMMLAAFDIGAAGSGRTPRRKPILSEAQIEQLEARVSRYFAQETSAVTVRRRRKTEDKTNVARSYFAELRKLLNLSKGSRRGASGEALWNLLLGQLQKMNRLFTEFERFDKKSEQAYSEIRRYLETLNRFLKDSSKQLKYDSRANALTFDIIDARGQTTQTSRGIEALSSGEQQIIILFTYIAFSRGAIFLIDEPEISLHPRWQEEFLDGVKDLMRPDTQLIVATHSPAIVGKYVDYCTTLLPYNQ
jgi:predicted ATPase